MCAAAGMMRRIIQRISPGWSCFVWALSPSVFFLFSVHPLTLGFDGVGEKAREEPAVGQFAPPRAHAHRRRERVNGVDEPGVQMPFLQTDKRENTFM